VKSQPTIQTPGPPVAAHSTPHIVIQPTSGWRLIDWKELYRYRDLFWLLSMRDVSVRYKQTIMGFGWAIIRPVVSMVIFSVVFGGLAQMPSDGVPYPLFSMCALIPRFSGVAR
jgi:lipopolysaccharide transport system permease protein